MTTPSRRDKANAIRALSMDAVQKANSGHPGAPMGMADIAEVVWSDYLKHNPSNPNWMDRDRFVLSNGHGSMLIYSLLYLSGYDLPLEEIINFRQLHSKTPGHPEYGYAPGIETTTGPLGQGISNAVGMAIAEKTLAAQFNRPKHNVVDHRTYVFLGDGCLMEGISHEVCSLAGTLGLGKLIAYYDDNGISIDGEVDGWFSDDTVQRFKSYGWHVVADVDGHDPAEVRDATQSAINEDQRPSLICCKTTIGFGSPNKGGKAASHGAPLGADEVERVREALGWVHAPFEIPQEIREAWDHSEPGSEAESEWNSRFSDYRDVYPELAQELERRCAGSLPADWESIANRAIELTDAEAESVATRKASQNALEKLAPELPELIGGSADLTGSNLTRWSGSRGLQDDADGNYIYYGVREFGMSSIINGIALHGGFIPYGGTFLMFSEYARNALRMAALMKQPSIFVFTHDSVGLGEDGPTHQPVEQLATLRLMPNMATWRPCDGVESIVAWRHAIESTDKPHSLIFSRQTLPHQVRDAEQVKGISQGGYVLSDCDNPQALIIATGSEVALAMDVAGRLKELNIRVISMPSTDVFDSQEIGYKNAVLPPHINKRISIEAGVTAGWAKYVGLGGLSIGIDTFGESGPAEEVFAHFGLTTDAVCERVQSFLLQS